MSDVRPPDPGDPTGAVPPPPPPPPPYGGGPLPGGYQPPSYGAAPSLVDPRGRPLAEWWKRLVAFLIDSAILFVGGLIILALARNFFVAWLVITIGAFVYFMLLNAAPRGQTVGKSVMGLQVVDATTGDLIPVGKAALRQAVVTVLGWACGILELVDGLWPLWDARRQAWHDKAAGTLVIDLGTR